MKDTLKEILRIVRIYIALPFLAILLIFLLLYIVIGGSDAITVCKKILNKINDEEI